MADHSILHGKKLLFAGNSMTYYGEVVINDEGSPTDREGIFSKLAKSFGDEIQVTNFTFGGAGFSDGRKKPLVDGLPEEYANYGLIQLMQIFHPGYVGNPQGLEVEDFYKQDYVILQQRGESLASTYDDAFRIAAMFPKGVRFVALQTHYDAKRPVTHDCLSRFARDIGGIAVDWGTLVCDISENKYAGHLKRTYQRSDFVITKDRVHPSFLSGYITALMLYCALTGKPEAAIGADHSFVRNVTEWYYTSPEDTTLPQILADREEMARIQELVAQRAAAALK